MTEAKAEAGVAAIPELGFTEALEAAFAAAADREARASGRPPERLGLEGQRERREGEEAARAFAAQSIRRLLDLGMTLVGAARLLCLPLRTAWEWLMRWTGPVPDLLARGRKPGAGSVAERMDVWETLEWHGPRVGVPTLRAAHPGLSRGVVREIKRDFVKAWKRANRKTIHVLRWYRPGAVWSMDFGNLPNLVAGVFSRFLPVKDLASRALIEVFPTKDMKAETVVALLEFLFDYYGEPLAIKSDNGSGFIDGEVRTLLEKRGVFLLLSPALLPSYNGGAEAGVGSVRGHALYHALATGDACEWTLDDIHAAKSRHNATPRSDGKTPGELFEARTPITPEEREAFRASVERHRRTALHRFDLAWKEKLSRDDLAKIDRYALRRALEELGYLSFRRRAITPAIPYKIRARIP